MIDSKSNPPAPDEFEISLIGTGGGYGECVIVHLGHGEWMIIDSCKSIDSSILPIEYLHSIGVNVQENVRLILCTHWDDDHIQGMSKVVEACPNAQFWISKVTDEDKFFKLVALDYQKTDHRGSISSTKEFVDSLLILEERNLVPKFHYAVQDRCLFKGNNCEVIALSPSDQTIQLFDRQIATALQEFSAKRKKLEVKQNHKSVVIFLKLGPHRALLGSDLEVTNSPATGWDCIVNTATTFDNPCTYFKIPHHGSANGHSELIWKKLVIEKPIGTITPWNRGKRLPQSNMIRKYQDLTGALYITSPAIFTSKSKSRDPEIERLIRLFKHNIREVKFRKGIIQSRIKQNDPSWKIQLFDSATHLVKN